MYPLKEKHPFCQEMQREMIQQIEDARPLFIVYVHVKDSWPQPKEEPYTDLPSWYPTYLKEHYRLAGLVELQKDRSTVTWSSQSSPIPIPDESREWVGIYRRNE